VVAGGVALLLLALALLPDHAVLRHKAHWTEALLAASVAGAAILAAGTGRLGPVAPAFLGAALLPAGVGAAWLLLAEPLSPALARDEVVRLSLLPLAAFAAGAVAGGRAGRRLLVGALLAGAVPVATLAVAQHLAGLLELPLSRMERPAATFGNPVFLGAFLVLVLPAALAATLCERGALRWLGATAAGVGLPAVVATQSRWAWLGLAVAVVAGTLWLVSDRRLRFRLLGGLLLLAAAGLLLNREALLRPHEHGLIWRDTLRLVADHPFGVGPGQFHAEFLPYASPELLEAYPRHAVIINDAHSEPLQLLGELGWAGLLAGGLALLVLAHAAVRALAATAPEDRPLALGLAAGLLGALVMSCGSPDQRFGVTPVVFGCLAGLLLSGQRPTALALTVPARILLAGAGLLVLFLGASRLHARLELSSLLAPPATLEAGAGAQAELRLVRELAAGAPQDPQACYRLGVAAAGARQWAEAADAFEACARLAPGLSAARRNAALMQAMAGRLDVAIPNLRDWLAAEPGDLEARYLLAYVHFAQGDVAASLREAEALLARQPDHRLGRLLMERLRE
jgi:O-antigen ligase